MQSETWTGKRVLVTGADGFVGSHLAEELVRLGARVSILVRDTSVSGTTGYSFKNLSEAVRREFERIICCDIASADTVELIVGAEPQILFHLAAVAYVPFSFDHPMEVTAVNLNGTLHVLEAAKRLPQLERVVCTSSSEVYGSALTKQIDESHPLNPTSPYAASKAAADRYCFSYHATYGLPIAIIRPFNSYGPRHTYDVIPKFIRLALHDEPLTIYGGGEQSRDFMYVTDTVNAFLTMGAHEQAIGQVVNFGTGQDISINTIAGLIKDVAGSASEITHGEERAAEVDRLCCDYGLARRLFGWEPRVDIEQGLKANIEWARQHWT